MKLNIKKLIVNNNKLVFQITYVKKYSKKSFLLVFYYYLSFKYPYLLYFLVFIFCVLIKVYVVKKVNTNTI